MFDVVDPYLSLLAQFSNRLYVQRSACLENNYTIAFVILIQVSKGCKVDIK